MSGGTSLAAGLILPLTDRTVAGSKPHDGSLIRLCAEAGCVCEVGPDGFHHGPHRDAQRPLPRQWWVRSPPGWPAASFAHHPSTCAACGAEEEAEVQRLAAGGALRPGQMAPKWLREGRPPPARAFRGACMPLERGRGGRGGAR